MIVMTVCISVDDLEGEFWELMLLPRMDVDEVYKCR